LFGLQDCLLQVLKMGLAHRMFAVLMDVDMPCAACVVFTAAHVDKIQGINHSMGLELSRNLLCLV
jgi:hypothetical protein